MREFLKQLFCKHIEKIEKSEYLYSTGQQIFGKFYTRKQFFANHLTCIKCGRKRIEEAIVNCI